MTPLLIILGYLALLLGLGLYSNRSFKGTSKDYFVASHSIGPFLLLMSVFGTTMTAFALVGSTGKAYERGIGVYGLMASASGLVHAAVFFLIGVRLWTYGKRYGYVTQIQFFRDRFESKRLGSLLFPILVGLVIPYLLIGIIGAGKTILPVTAGAFPELFPNPGTPQWAGGIPPWLTGLVVCSVVLAYVFAGGSRGAAWANTFQTLVFMVMGVVAFVYISSSLGGPANAAKIALKVRTDGKVVQSHRFDPKTRTLIAAERVVGELVREPGEALPKAEFHPHLRRSVTKLRLRSKNRKTGKIKVFDRELGIPALMFLSYMLIPLSVGMFPHLFQHWLTAKNADAFKLVVVAHPLCIMIVWVPCVLIGVWATGIVPPLESSKVAAVLGIMVRKLVGSPALTGFLTAGILAAIMSSLDSQFLCLGTMFTTDVVLERATEGQYSDAQIVRIARIFIVVIVALTYLLSLVAPQNVFDLAIWCFSGFSSLFPLVLAALYWRRATLAGAYASIAAAMGVWLVFFHLSGYGGEFTVLDGVMPVAFCVGASALAMILVSLITQPPSPETLAKFFPSPSAPRQESP